MIAWKTPELFTWTLARVKIFSCGARDLEEQVFTVKEEKEIFNQVHAAILSTSHYNIKRFW